MGNVESHPSSNGVNKLAARMRKLFLGFLVFQILSLIVLLFSIEFTTYREKNNLAKSISQSLANDLFIKNYRRISEVLNVSVNSDFLKIEFRDFSAKRDMIVSGHGSSTLPISIIIPVYFDANRTTKIGELSFYYDPMSALLEISIAWVALLFVSGILLHRFRSTLLREYFYEFEIAKAKEKALVATKVAHDIRSPLTALNALMLPSVDLNLNENREVIRNVSSRINGIAENLLEDLKPINIHHTDLVTSNLGVLPLFRKSIVNLIEEKKLEYSGNTGISLSFRDNTIADVKIQSNFDANQLKRILSNLINNSVEAVESDGSIFVELVASETDVIVSVIDFGKGMSDEVQSRLGNGLVTFGKETSSRSGSGIGVFSAAQYLSTVGGKMKIESKLGVGTKVSLIFPILKG